ncbi:MAG: M15 family metallopeptidase [Candidatus Accumulibacter sp.]|jgi:peptidoglycan L-alanyl-D-glutamate endopeptidase CwlK|nr:M15 family metallopeptidase [Accumulibacter sp.]
MIDSRNPDELAPAVRAMAEAFIAVCKAQGIDLVITSTYRDAEKQDALYALGRTKPGKVVTNAKGGQSFHNWRVAFDAVPLRGGKPVWNTRGDDGKLWEKIGAIGEAVGLEWGGRWKKFPDYPHFQCTNGRSLADFQKGEAHE